MSADYVKLIGEIDRVLAMVREFWLSAGTEEEKARWRRRIDQSLDERLRLMTKRDEAKQAEVAA